MKHLVSCLFMLPLLTACTSEGYYPPGYYGSPPPRVEVQGYYPQRHYHNNPGYRVAPPQAGVFHGHANNRRGNAVIVPSHAPQAQVSVQSNTTHGHNNSSANSSSHSQDPHASASVHVNEHVHNNTSYVTKNLHPTQAGVNAQNKNHGHS
jgi:hypothetical protein